jgi:type I restriction enzyme S subunit
VDPAAPIRYGIVQPGEVRDSGIPLVRVCDLVDDRVAWSGHRRVSREVDKKCARGRIENDDILVKRRLAWKQEKLFEKITRRAPTSFGS